MNGTFTDRIHAGRSLAHWLRDFAGRLDVTVFALSRGGVPVAYEVAHALGTPLDVILVRKLGVPGQEEIAMGAIATGGIVVRDEEVIDSCHVTAADFAAVLETESVALARQEHAYGDDRLLSPLTDRTVILVDDGITTSATIRAAIRATRLRGARIVVVAVPVTASSTVHELRHAADSIVAVLRPASFVSMGEYYEDFAPVADAEVHRLLAANLREHLPSVR